MIEVLTPQEQEALYQVYTQGVKDGTLPEIICEEDLPVDTLPIYVNGKVYKRFKKK